MQNSRVKLSGWPESKALADDPDPVYRMVRYPERIAVQHGYVATGFAMEHGRVEPVRRPPQSRGNAGPAATGSRRNLLLQDLSAASV